MPTRTQFGTKIQKGETYTYTATITDETGAAVDLTAGTVNAFVTLYFKSTNAAINTRNNQQVVTAGVASNNHTVTAGGLITFKATASDSVVTGSADSPVVYRLEIDYQDGAAVARTAIHEVEFTIEELPTVT